jgi:hypothetical protein
MKSTRRCSVEKQEWIHWNSEEVFDKKMARQLLIKDKPKEKSDGHNRGRDSEVRG